jgi:small subunit ribosomal protein S1
LTSDPEYQPGGSEEEDPDRHTDMATLLEEHLESRSPQRGEIIEGTVMGWDREGALIDIGAKSEGVIQRHEMQSLGANPEAQIQTGAKVLVYIVHPESADGQIVLSLDRARGERGWHELQARFESGESFEGEVTGYNKGGLLVNVEGVNAFVPMSQLTGVRPDRNRDDGGTSSLAEAVGRTLRLKVIEINRRRNRVILSERAALQEWRMQQKERLIQELREGDIRRGRITSVRNFGVFVDLGGADGLAHLSELSWERDKSPTDLFQVGDEVDVYITKIDAENKKIALSLRRARPEQWDAIVDKYKENSVVVGLVTKLVTFGAFARIEGPVEGLIHVSELVDRRIGHPKEVVREGDLLPLKIVRIERDRHRLGLSLRRAREEGEGLGFVFSDGGEVISVPGSIRAEFEEREGPIPPPREEDEEDISERAAAISAQPSEATVSRDQPEATMASELAPAARIEEPETTSMAEAFASAGVGDEPITVADEPAALVEEPRAGGEDSPLSDLATVSEEPPVASYVEDLAASTESAEAVEAVPAPVEELPVQETEAPVEQEEEAPASL